MKKLPLFIFLFIFYSLFASAQITKLIVSMHGGKDTLGEFRYNSYKYCFSSHCGNLTCTDPGYEKCEINSTSQADEHSRILFNMAIKKSIEYIRNNNNKNGEFNLTIQEKMFSVKYANADKTGEADLIIEII
jgi:hypothetical protein